MLATVFLSSIIGFGMIFLNIRPSDLVSLVIGGIAVALSVSMIPYIVVFLKKKRRHIRRIKSKKRGYSIFLLTDNSPEYEASRLKLQAERINVIIRDLNAMCSRCISKKCSKCSIKQEIVPTLEKIKRKMAEAIYVVLWLAIVLVV